MNQDSMNEDRDVQSETPPTPIATLLVVAYLAVASGNLYLGFVTGEVAEYVFAVLFLWIAFDLVRGTGFARRRASILGVVWILVGVLSPLMTWHPDTPALLADGTAAIPLAAILVAFGALHLWAARADRNE